MASKSFVKRLLRRTGFFEALGFFRVLGFVLKAYKISHWGIQLDDHETLLDHNFSFPWPWAWALWWRFAPAAAPLSERQNTGQTQF